MSHNGPLSLGTAANAGEVRELNRAWCSWPFPRDKERETAGCSEVTPGGSSRSGGVNTVDVGRAAWHWAPWGERASAGMERVKTIHGRNISWWNLMVFDGQDQENNVIRSQANLTL